MKKIILALLLATFSLNGFSTTWTIVNSGFTFSPSTVTIKQGDNVVFTLESIHDALEVSKTVWDANGNASNNGFSVPFGGGTVLPSSLTIGTHYYVCSAHAFFGMKGIIIVQAASGLAEPISESIVSVYSNPVSDQLSVRLNLSESTNLEVTLYDIQGKLASLLLPKTPVSGAYSQTFMISNQLISGVYFVRITLGDNTTYRKVIHL